MNLKQKGIQRTSALWRGIGGKSPYDRGEFNKSAAETLEKNPKFEPIGNSPLPKD
jgi:hypothetical protein